jgi:hypothetical protein
MLQICGGGLSRRTIGAVSVDVSGTSFLMINSLAGLEISRLVVCATEEEEEEERVSLRRLVVDMMCVYNNRQYEK